MKATPEMLEAGGDIIFYRRSELKDSCINADEVAREVWDAMSALIPKRKRRRRKVKEEKA